MSTQFIKTDESGRQVCGLLDGRAVSSFRLRLPKLSDAKLQRALPHIMSDYLTDNDNLSFCHMPLAKGDADNGYSLVFACAKDRLDELIGAAQAEQLEMSAIWPDYMQVPQPDEGVAIIERDGDILARRADGTGFRLPKALADAAIGEAQIITADPATLPAAPGFAIGRFGTQLPIADILAAVKRPLILAGAAIAIWLAATLYGGFSVNQKAAELAQSGEDMFRKKFPEVRRVVNVEAQLRNRLGGVGGSSFSGHSSQLLAALQSLPDIRLEAMEFIGGRNQSMDITLSARNFSALEKARQKLAMAGFRVEEGKSEQSNQLVIGQFTLSLSGGRR